MVFKDSYFICNNKYCYYNFGSGLELNKRIKMKKIVDDFNTKWGEKSGT